MKSTKLLLVLVCVIAQPVWAGVKIETLRRDAGQGQSSQQSNQQASQQFSQQASDKASEQLDIVYVQDGSARMQGQRSGAVILKDGKIYMVDDQRKSYREFDKATMQQYASQLGAAMNKMQEQLKNMSPERRAQMEKMMGGAMPGMANAAQDVYDAKDTGKSDVVEGRSCRVWHMNRNGALFQELCVVPYGSLPGKEDFQAIFKQFAEAFEGLDKVMPGANKQTRAYSAVNGYPVRVRSISEGKPTGEETVLKSWQEESVPAAMFVVPAGYKKQEMPRMGH